MWCLKGRVELKASVDDRSGEIFCLLLYVCKCKQRAWSCTGQQTVLQLSWFICTLGKPGHALRSYPSHHPYCQHQSHMLTVRWHVCSQCADTHEHTRAMLKVQHAIMTLTHAIPVHIDQEHRTCCKPTVQVRAASIWWPCMHLGIRIKSHFLWGHHEWQTTRSHHSRHSTPLGTGQTPLSNPQSFLIGSKHEGLF